MVWYGLVWFGLVWFGLAGNYSISKLALSLAQLQSQLVLYFITCKSPHQVHCSIIQNNKYFFNPKHLLSHLCLPSNFLAQHGELAEELVRVGDLGAAIHHPS